MELLLKNVDPKDFVLLTDLSKRLGIEVETKAEVVVEKPYNKTMAEDLKEALEEIRLAEASGIELQDAKDLINEL